MKILQNLTVILIQLGEIYRKFAAESIQLKSYVTSIKYFVAMKRYLISGALTLITGLFLTSCHDKDMEYSFGASQKTQAYDQAFKETFGTPAAGHNWGFAIVEDDNTSAATTRAFTRGHNKESNQWASQGWIIPDPLTPEQKDKVRRYFQQNPNPRGISVNYTDFFVQQVYKGGSNLTGSQTQESYYYGNGDYVCGSSNMDKLTAGTMEDHINDFNYGDRGEINVQNNNKSGEHNDAITLMVNSQTNCFGFHNSRDSKQYNDQYVIIPGNAIDEWDPSAPSVTGMFFVGFDFEANKNAYDTNGNLSANSNMYLVTETTAANGVAIPNKNDGKRYHIGGADGYYSDWIVRITKGVKVDNSTVSTTTQVTEDIPRGSTYRITKWKVKDQGRVFCEDLGGNYTTDREDFDFNDIVFDAVVWSKQEFIWEEQAVQDTDADGNPLWEQEEVAVFSEAGTPVYNFGDGETTTIPEGKTESEIANAIVTTWADKLDSNGNRIPVYKKDSNGDFVYESVELTEYRGNEEYYAEIVLLATGATIGASVAGEEVHNAFGVGHTTMVNTVGGSSTAFGSYVDKTPVYLGELKRIESPSLDAIPITVLWNTGIDGATKLRTFNTAAGSAFAGAPQKFQVPIGTSWAQERIRIDKAYPGFLTYVTNPNYDWTRATGEDAPDALLLFEQNYPNLLSGKSDYEDTEVVNGDNYHSASSEIVSGDPVDNTSVGGGNGGNNGGSGGSNTQPSSGASVVKATPGAGETKIYNVAEGTDFGDYKDIHFTFNQFEGVGVGSVIRVYGYPTQANYAAYIQDGYNSTAFINTGATETSGVTFESHGYREFTVTEGALSEMKTRNGMHINGNHFKLTFVTINNSNVKHEEKQEGNTNVVVSGEVWWENSNGVSLSWGGEVSIPASKFANSGATSTSKLRFYGEYTTPSGWQIYLKDQSYSDIVQAAWERNNDIDTKGYVEFTLGNYLSRMVNNGLLVQGNGFKITHVTFIK